MTFTPGSRLGPYEILSPLGAGGMGEVYRARDTRLDRTVAIKILPAALASDPQFRDRFEREAKAIAALTHPHICTLYDVGRHPSTGSGQAVDFLVMEHLEGETLAQRLEQGGLPLDQALRLAIQIADALDKAHRAGIVHRDLKPANVMLTKAGAKLLDFGLAKVTPAVVAASGLSMAPTGVTPVTMQGAILGTLQYMAPEQIEGQEADARTDIFAFGCVLYEMLTGRKAFEGKTQASLIGAILKDTPPPMSALQPLAPSALDRIVTTCMAKEPDDRWQTARDLLRELTWVREEHGVAPRLIASAPRRRWAYAGWAVAAMMTIAAIAVTVFASRPSTPDLAVTRLDLVTPSTDDPFSFAVSPDGRAIAFVAQAAGGATTLWLRSFEQATARSLAGTEGASYPFWAPDNRTIGFFADGKLKRVDLAGGAPQVIADAPQGRGGTWNKDGVIVFAPTALTTGLMRVPAGGGTPVPVTRLTASQGSRRWPQFLPDGRRVLFFQGLGSPESHGVYVASLDGDEPTLVVGGETAAVYAAPGYLLRVSQGALVAQSFDAARATVAGEPIPVAQGVGADDGTFRSAFSVSPAGVLAYRMATVARRQLVWLDRQGKVQGAIGSPDESVPSSPALAPDGQHVAWIRVLQGNYDVWLMDLGRSASSRFTFDPAIDYLPIWSPDGKRIVFTSTRKGGGLFEKPANGAADEQLLVTSRDMAPLDWSPDGRVLLGASESPKTQSDLWALPLTGGRKPFPVVQTSFDDIQGQFSPDGRWLAYASNESGRYEIYVQSFPEARGKWQVSTAGGLQPRWRRDGTELYFVAADDRLMAVPIRVASDGSAVDAGVPAALFPTRLAKGANVVVAGANSRAQYAVASDGRFLMNVSVDDAAAAPPMTVVQNWTAALKK